MYSLNKSWPNTKIEKQEMSENLNTGAADTSSKKLRDLRYFLNRKSNGSGSSYSSAKRKHQSKDSTLFKRRRFTIDSHTVEPLYKNHQLLGDSQFVRFAEQLLSYSHYTTYADNTVLRRIGYCVSGQKIKDLTDRLEAREFPIHPNVITLIGTNDIFYETRMSDMCKNYDRMLEILKEKCDKIVLLTVPPVARNENKDSHWQTLKFFNDYVHQYADDHQVFVVDLCSLFISYHNSVSKEYYESVFNTGPKVDLLHLNKKGFKMLQSILQVQYFDKIGAATD